MTNPVAPVDTAVAAVQQEQRGLGLAWDLRPGTVVEAASASAMRVLIDNDQLPTPNVLSLDGPNVAGARVMVLSIPNGGLYCIGMYGGNTPRQQTNAELVAATNALTLITDTPTLVPGCTISLTLKGAARYKATAFVDFDETSAGSAIGVATLYIDSVAHSSGSQAILEMLVATDRATVGQQWAGTVSAGTHLFELMAWRVGPAAGTERVNQIHTTLSVDTYE